MWELWKTKIESTWGETESRVWVSWELRLLRVRLCERGETESRGQRAVAWSTKTREGEKEQKMRTVDWDIGFLSKRCVLQLFYFLFFIFIFISAKRCVSHLLFFLFFEFRPESAGSAPVSVVVADTDRFGPNRRVSRRKKEKKRNTAPTRRQRRRPPHPASELHKYSPFWKI